MLSFIPQMLKILLREWFKCLIHFISVTECGFGADIGMEKFFNIKCRYSGNYSIFHQIEAIRFRSDTFFIVSHAQIGSRFL